MNDAQAVSTVNIEHDVTLITLDSVPNQMSTISAIFTAIAEAQINIDMISQSTPYGGMVNISFSLPSQDLVKVINVLGNFKNEIPDLRVDVNANNSKLSIHGEGMRNTPGVAAKFFRLLDQKAIQIKLITTSEVDISCLIYERDMEKLEMVVKQAFDI